MSLKERLLFIKEFKENFELTGALTPSSQFLAKAIVSEFAKHTQPSVILEVGPGTGVFTAAIAEHMIPGDQLHICEISTPFAVHIQQRINTDPLFAKVRSQITVHNLPIQELTVINQYDYIISSLPMNNFSIPLVKEIQAYFKSHLKKEGSLCFFEYIGLRRIKCYFLLGEPRKQLKELDVVLRSFVRQYQYKHHYVPINLFPAHVRHLKF